MKINSKFQEIMDSPSPVSDEVKNFIKKLNLIISHKYEVFVIPEMNQLYNLEKEIQDPNEAVEYEWQINKFYTLDYQNNCGCKTSYEVAYLILEIYKILKKQLDSFPKYNFVIEGWIWDKNFDPDVDESYGGIRFHCVREQTQSCASQNIDSSPCAIILDSS